MVLRILGCGVLGGRRRYEKATVGVLLIESRTPQMHQRACVEGGEFITIVNENADILSCIIADGEHIGRT